MNHKDLKLISSNILKKQIVYIPQEPILFSKTIESNIFITSSTLCKENINLIPDLFLKDWLSSYQQKLQTPLGSYGSPLSGGQKQRLSLSSLFLKNPEWILLDESFSAMDPQTEWLSRKSLFEAFPHAGFLSVTHRFDGLHEFDFVIFLENGQIKKFAPYEEIKEDIFLAFSF